MILREAARVSGKGTWTIGSFPDEGPGMRIEFEPKGGRPVRSCRIWSVFTGKKPLSEMYPLNDDGKGERYRRQKPVSRGQADRSSVSGRRVGAGGPLPSGCHAVGSFWPSVSQGSLLSP